MKGATFVDPVTNQVSQITGYADTTPHLYFSSEVAAFSYYAELSKNFIYAIQPGIRRPLTINKPMSQYFYPFEDSNMDGLDTALLARSSNVTITIFFFIYLMCIVTWYSIGPRFSIRGFSISYYFFRSFIIDRFFTSSRKQ